MKHLAQTNPRALHAALSTVAENLVAYSGKPLKSVRRYFHVRAWPGKEIVSREIFLTLRKPYALKVFQAVSARAVGNEYRPYPQARTCTWTTAWISLWTFSAGGIVAPTWPFHGRCQARFPGCVMARNRPDPSSRALAGLPEDPREPRRFELGGGRRFFHGQRLQYDTWVSPEGRARPGVAAARISGR